MSTSPISERISAACALSGVTLIAAAFLCAGSVTTAQPPPGPWIAALAGLALIGLGAGLPRLAAHRRHRW
ncbi:MAG TPA: hypothetical protein VG248_15725 [Caulobacteraceae bacterium]|jgi:predicted benzoate:H+ symporter BenE|nr:hypothetical protein [Caulobacteraceae bacterium]